MKLKEQQQKKKTKTKRLKNKKKKFNKGIRQQNSDKLVHSKTIILASLQYVYNSFFPLFPSQIRLNTKDYGFSFYDKVYSNYCFDEIHNLIHVWKFKNIYKKQEFMNLAKQLVGIGCRQILRQILSIINLIIQFLKDKKRQRVIVYQLINNEEIKKKYRFMRLDKDILQNLGFSNLGYTLQKNAKKVWKPFIQIIVHSVYQLFNGRYQNKYYQSLLQDAIRNQRKSRLQQIIQEIQNTHSKSESSINNQYMIDFCNTQKNHFQQIIQELPFQKQSIFYQISSIHSQTHQQIVLSNPSDQVLHIIQDTKLQKKQIQTSYSQQIKLNGSILQITNSQEEPKIKSSHSQNQKIGERLF